MALALRATEAVKQLLRSLRADPVQELVYAALEERITVIRTDPGSRLARGVERQMQPSGILARATVVDVRDRDERWVIVWTAVADEEGEAVQLRHIERYQGADGPA